MSAVPPAPAYAVDLLLLAAGVLRDSAAWSAYLAAIATQRPGKTVLASQPAGGDVEFCPSDMDDLSPVQSYPAVRLDVLQSDDSPGINYTVGRTAHLLEVRTYVRATTRSDLLTGQRSNLSTLSLILEEQHRAHLYLLTAGLVPAGASIGLYNVLPQGNKSRLSQAGQGSTTFARASSTLLVYQATRSARFDAPPQETP